ncbi:hypothetical protein GEMMAAP_15490 [Gemmatimonas phototrophica]|uniref:Inositolphosphotransferase Aur1/Ipt1 domain-containing protein n=1 Tax=Gemmatimonas phototrophica TaxID=1379270 RepID=A0A143BMV0_9BACT|nr:hypothetical protein GEMMAAP_15490 [Gemmatimonas phototrophica]
MAQFATLLAIGLPFWYSRENKQFIRVGLLYFIHIGALAIFVGLRSYADETARPVIVEAPITFDLWLGNGQLPTHMLQQWLYSEGDVAWYDQLMAVLYAGHFFVIWLAALFLWAKDEVRFSAFMLSNVLCYFISLAVHFAYPTAPPWLASQNEVIENVSRIFLKVGSELSPEAVKKGIDISGNDVAAMPSVHMMVTWLVFLSAARIHLVVSILAGIYALLMLWGIVYGGEHYLVDALMGIAMASFGWWTTHRVIRGRSDTKSRN